MVVTTNQLDRHDKAAETAISCRSGVSEISMR